MVKKIEAPFPAGPGRQGTRTLPAGEGRRKKREKGLDGKSSPTLLVSFGGTQYSGKGCVGGEEEEDVYMPGEISFP